MARLLTIDSCTVNLKNSLLSVLHPTDEAILLPQSDKSIESGSFKNIVFRLDGSSTSPNAAIFSPDWFTGISLVRIKGRDVDHIDSILSSEETRKQALLSLCNTIKSEVADSSLEVGPPLESDDCERDLEGTTWNNGFDSPSCFVGIFSADHSKVPENGKPGMNRSHKDYFLVCKAGAGVSASTFQARLQTSLSKGATLDQALETEVASPGPQALRRLMMAGYRNRSRIMLDASKAIGLIEVSSVGDQAARNKHRGIVADIDAVANTIRKLDDTPRSTWQYSTCIDGVFSKGLVSHSNAAEGVVLFMSSSGDSKIVLKNETWGCIPYTSKRVSSSRTIVDEIVSAHRALKSKGVHVGQSSSAHPDSKWISSRIGWKNRVFSETQVEVEPFGLWGSHQPEQYVQSFARELGIADYKAIRLRPELVCSAGVESGKLRAVVRAVEST